LRAGRPCFLLPRACYGFCYLILEAIPYLLKLPLDGVELCQLNTTSTLCCYSVVKVPSSLRTPPTCGEVCAFAAASQTQKTRRGRVPVSRLLFPWFASQFRSGNGQSL